jgi:Zn-dependent oligopeptidase
VGPVLTYCKNDEVRRRTQHEYRSRCPGNIDVLQKILQGCHNKAQILGYPNYAALDLEGRLALRGLSNVTDFIDNVVAKWSNPKPTKKSKQCPRFLAPKTSKSGKQILPQGGSPTENVLWL